MEGLNMADMSAKIAVKKFEELNPHKVKFVESEFGNYIVTNVDPESLTYPEGWYCAKGSFRNKGKTTTGMYEEIPFVME